MKINIATGKQGINAQITIKNISFMKIVTFLQENWAVALLIAEWAIGFITPKWRGIAKSALDLTGALIKNIKK